MINSMWSVEKNHSDKMVRTTSTLLCLVYMLGKVILESTPCMVDTESHICCPHGRELRYNTDGLEQGCCFNRTYSLDTQLCCGELVVQKYAANGRETKCCSSTQYDPLDKMCCRAKLYDKVLGEQSGCCGKAKFDCDSHICCTRSKSYKLHERQSSMKCCGTDYFNITTHYCTPKKKVLQLHQSLCGNQTYDVRKSKCCNQTLYNQVSEKDPNYKCCSNEIYNTADQSCCKWNDGYSLISSNVSCCHRDFYDKQTEMCCDDGPIKYTKKSEQCCGNGLYDSDWQGCCNTIPYNLSTHECCSSYGNIIAKDSDSKCCGSDKYDSTSYVCCEDDTIIKKSQDNHDSCCSSGNGRASFKSFSSSTHICTLGSVLSNGKDMCGPSVWNKETDLCCQGKFYEAGRSEGSTCCGVHMIGKDSDVKCCSSEKYNSTSQICCQDYHIIREKSEDNHDSCCFSDNVNTSFKSFSSSTHKCSHGTVLSNGQNKCGPSVWNKEKDLCCQEQLYHQGRLNGSICCGSAVFSPVSHICCADTIYSRQERKGCYSRKNRPNGTKGKTPRNYGICRICKKSQRFFIKSLKSKTLDICRRQALTVKITGRKMMDSESQTLNIIVKKDLYSGKNFNREEIEVNFPCRCKIRRSEVILMTDSEDFTKPLRLGDSDVLLPWNKRFKTLVIKNWKKCVRNTNSLLLHNMLEIKSFVDYKYNKISAEKYKTL